MRRSPYRGNRSRPPRFVPVRPTESERFMGNSSWGLSRVLRPMGGVGIPIALVAAMCALGAAALSAAAAVAATPSAHWTWRGGAPANGRVSVALPLKADLAGLERFTTTVSDPGSSQYGQFESIANLATRFGAPAAERARVVGYLRRAGATGVKVDVTGLFAEATMRVSQAGRMFGTTLGDFRTGGAPAPGARFTAPETGGQIPSELRHDVTGVVGLDTQPLFGSPTPTLSGDTPFPRKPAVAGRETTAD